MQVYKAQHWQDFVMSNGGISAEFTEKPVFGTKRARCLGQPADPYVPRGPEFVVA